MSNIVISNATPIISLCSVGYEFVLNAGYQIARHFGLPAIRTLSILKVAKDKKIINKIRPIVEQMVQRGRWYSKNVIDKFLGDVGE